MLMLLETVAAAGGSVFDPFKHAVNELTKPAIFLTLCTVVFVLMFVLYKWWTKPVIALVLFVGFCLFYFGSIADPNYRAIVSKPDNVPISIMVITVMLCIWVAFRRAAINDSRVAAGLPLTEEDKDDKVLVYFDPWMAGVVYPGMIIVGLCAMPYIDVNPKGNGYYTLRERPFAIVTWLFGFLILWVVLIFFGTFLRGPNWSFFGPYEYWDAHKQEALNNVVVSNFFWNYMLNRARPTADNNPVPVLPHWLVRE